MLHIAAFGPIMAGAIYLLIFLPAAPAIAVIQATVESVSFDVAAPEMAQLPLKGFALSFETPAAQGNLGFTNATASSPTARRPLCLTGILVPEPGTRVTYKRFGSNPVSVVIERRDGKPAAVFDIDSGALPQAARQASWIRLDGNVDSEDEAETKRNCPGDTPTRLPVYGVAEIGGELRPASRGDEPSSGLLLEGTIDIFARTLELSALADAAPRIYPAAGGTITIPPGARIREYRGETQQRQPWVGFVQINEDEQALRARVTTPAMRIALLRPGVGMEPEVLSIGLFTQLANDPALISAQIAAAFLFSIFHILSAVLAWLANRRENRGRADDASRQENLTASGSSASAGAIPLYSNADASREGFTG
ncbi:MAG: hypothetical protein ACK4MV_08150 [Beijerinckiaceae bacterium]